MTRSYGFRIKITRIGYMFIALCLAVGISGLNTGNNLLYLIFSMMLSFIVLSGLLSNNTLQRLSIDPLFPSRIFAKQNVPVQLTLENNKKWFPSFSLSILADQHFQQQKKGSFIVKIPPGQTEQATDFVQFPKRGKASLPPYTVETSYPFGLIRKFTTVPSSGETIIYPELVKLESFLSSDRRLQGDFLSGQTGGASNPYGIREFVYGDAARLIHWKTSARTGTLKVKEFEKEKKLRVVIDVVLAPKEQMQPQLQERAISVASSLLMYLAVQNYELSMNLNGEKIESRGRGYLDSYLSALALATPGPLSVPSSPGDENVIVVTDRHHFKTPSTCILFLGPTELSRA